MNTRFLFLFLNFIIPYSLFAQSTLYGDWNIVSINNGELYYNFENDSLLVFPEFGETDLDSSQLVQIKVMSKFLYSENKFQFDQEGNYKWQFRPTEVTTGKYLVFEGKNIITFFQEDPDEENRIEFPFEIINNQLEVTITFSEPQGKFVYRKSLNNLGVENK
ncbi:hypothetical protein [Algoriphagus pacificus]|uniref:Lipocalin-like domain-containing protein n=1 Tax=Algoriphagus pacificus TaxID=2811234 RepID=A0ABS3CNF9_9BACT|nr:hypothetical protein [Algoriphagus pacificus]MBN7817991.1 hypothetical protein [Algoriphagus pacificus]